jgi:uncharacterized protein YjbJ (UPF0337 family)
MNNDTFQGQWKQLRGAVKETFGRLTDDDLLQAEGNVDKMLGALQTRYGYTKAQAETQWNKFTQQHADKVDAAKAALNTAAADLKTAADHVKDALKR